MALDSAPSCPSNLGSNRATSTQQRIRKDERTWTTETYAPYDDGHQWRKYGEKKLSNSSFPRFYYRCTYKNDMKCPATKQVQQKDTDDPPLFSVTYFNQHTCNSSSRPIGSSPDAPARSSPRKAVSICFDSHTINGQPTFLTSSATLKSAGVQPHIAADQQLDASAASYTSRFQWADASSSASNAPVKMGADDFAETSASSSTTAGAPSRTLVPIGQSRSIEYFHFL